MHQRLPSALSVLLPFILAAYTRRAGGGYSVINRSNNRQVAACETQEEALLVANALSDQHGRGQRLKDGPHVSVVVE